MDRRSFLALPLVPLCAKAFPAPAKPVNQIPLARRFHSKALFFIEIIDKVMESRPDIEGLLRLRCRVAMSDLLHYGVMYFGYLDGIQDGARMAIDPTDVRLEGGTYRVRGYVEALVLGYITWECSSDSRAEIVADLCALLPRIEQSLSPVILKHVLTFHKYDSQGHLFLPSCFSNEHGCRLSLRERHDYTKPLGFATIVVTPLTVTAEVPYKTHRRIFDTFGPYELSAEFQVSLSDVGTDFFVLGSRIFQTGRLTALGVIRPEEKIT